MILNRFFPLFIILSIVTSCSSESGCKDPEADNFGEYDIHVQEECIYYSSQFFGDFTSGFYTSVSCTLPDTSYSDSLNYLVSISKLSDESILINNLFNFGKNIEASFINDTLRFNDDSFGGDSFVQASGYLVPSETNSAKLDFFGTHVTPDCGSIVTGRLNN